MAKLRCGLEDVGGHIGTTTRKPQAEQVFVHEFPLVALKRHLGGDFHFGSSRGSERSLETPYRSENLTTVSGTKEALMGVPEKSGFLMTALVKFMLV